MLGPGRYNDACTLVRERTMADGVVLIIVGGAQGSGVSVQGPLHFHLTLATLLREMAQEIEIANAREGVGPWRRAT